MASKENDMPKSHVHTAFTLQHKGEKRHFPLGAVVPADLADHWYVKAHTSAEPITDPSTSAAADAMLADLEAKEKALAAIAADLAATGDVLDKRHKDVDQREDAVSRRERLAAEQQEALDARQAALDAREQALAEREKAAQNAQSTAKDDSKSTAKANVSK
jgi:multidrug resistance efflux pump